MAVGMLTPGQGLLATKDAITDSKEPFVKSKVFDTTKFYNIPVHAYLIYTIFPLSGKNK